MVAVEPGAIVSFDQSQPLLIEAVEWRQAAVHVVKDAQLHDDGSAATFPCNRFVPRVRASVQAPPPASIMALMQTLFINANGLRFEVLEEGSGDRLALCLHGFPEHAVSWRHQMPLLANMGYRVWAVNQRGYGRTSRPQRIADYALPHLIEDVAGLIDAAQAREVVLIGHDWGAMVAWCLAALQRRPLHRLVIMNVPHPLCFRAALKHWRQMRKSWYVAFFQLPWLPERMLASGSGAAVNRIFAGVTLPPEVRAVYRNQIAEPGAATAMLNWYRAMRVQTGASQDLERVIETPTLLIW